MKTIFCGKIILIFLFVFVVSTKTYFSYAIDHGYPMNIHNLIFHGLKDFTEIYLSDKDDPDTEIQSNYPPLKLKKQLPKGENKEEFCEKIFFGNSKSNYYYIIKPRNFDPDKEYLLLIALHGYGGSANTFLRLWNVFRDESIIFIVPEAPYSVSQRKRKGYAWYPSEEVSENERSKIRYQSEDYIISLVKQLKNEFKCKETYLFGFSQGGAMTYTVGLKNQELFTGLIVWGCSLEKNFINPQYLTPGAQLRILVLHGTADRRIPFKLGRDSFQQLKKKGFTIDFIEYNGGHNIPQAEVKKVKEWILK